MVIQPHCQSFRQEQSFWELGYWAMVCHGVELKAQVNKVTWGKSRAEDVRYHVLVRTLIVKGLTSGYEGLNPSQSAQDHIGREGPVS